MKKFIRELKGIKRDLVCIPKMKLKIKITDIRSSVNSTSA